MTASAPTLTPNEIGESKLPVFFLCDKIALKIGEGIFFTKLRIDDKPAGGRAVVLFTDEGLAQEYRSRNCPESTLRPIYDMGDFEDNLIGFQRLIDRGVTWAKFVTGTDGTGFYESLDSLLAWVRRQLELRDEVSMQ